MSLQIWLPLDGTLENKGCCQGEFSIKSTLTYTNNGKIGKALSNGSITMPATMATSILNNNSFSFCCWIYVNAETGDTSKRNLLFGNDPMGELNNRKFSIFQYPNCNSLHTSWMNDTANTVWDGYVLNDVLPSYQWTHIAITYENPISKIYINGVLKDTHINRISNSSSFAYETYLFRAVSDEGRYINDYRVYDTCLSAAEVNEIAQGLVLHYKLSLHLNWLDYVSQKSITRGSGNNFTDYTYNSALKNCTDTQYTVDFDAKGTADDMNIDIYFRDSSGAAYAATAQQIITTDWKHYSLAINGSPENLVLFRVRLWGGTVGDIAYFKNMTLTSQNMPYNETKVIDSSGYGRHGDVVGTAQFSTDTARYGNSYIMDGVVANRIEYNKTTFNYTDNFSWAIWVKENHTGDAAQYVFTSGRADAGGYGFGLQNSDDTGLNCRFGNKSYRINVTKNEWVHIAYTKSGTTQKLYKNGELYSTQTFDGTLPTYSDGKGLGLGCFHYTGNIYPAYGNISDFRIYCTALSAEAIKDLYQTSLKIDKAGKDHTYELVEDDGLNITKTGKFISPIYIESGYNFYEGGDISYTPTANKANSTCPNHGIIDLSSVADLGLPINLKFEFDFSWENFAFLESTTTLLQYQGASRLKSNGTLTWTNGIGNWFNLKNYVSTSTSSGNVHYVGTKLIPAEKFEIFDGLETGMRCDYSDGNGTLSISNFKVTLADNITKFTKSYVSANEFIER